MKTFKLILIAVLLITTSITKAQDVIVKKDNSTILSKVTRISEAEIEYKKWSNLDGPTYVIGIDEVVSINYQNGEIEHFAYEQETPITTQNKTTTNQEIITTNQLPTTAKGSMKRRGYTLTLDGHLLSDEEVKNLVDVDTYQTYLSAKRQIKAGRAFTTVFFISLGTTLMFTVTAEDSGDPDLLMMAYGSGVIAGISLPLMCIFKGIGKGRMNRIADNYNSKSRGYFYSYNLSPSLIKYKTPELQDNYGLGLTFSVNF